MKFYDKGFINKYDNYTQVQIFSAGTAILDMKIYEDRVCKSTFECQDLKTFNKENLSSSYADNFIKELFQRNEKEIVHRDSEHKILIKIKRD
jgi:ubiquinone biosynthesis protein Coq4